MLVGMSAFASNGIVPSETVLSIRNDSKGEQEIYKQKYDDTKYYICCAEGSGDAMYCAFANTAGEACSKAAALANQN
jgi:hypothetical protein